MIVDLSQFEITAHLQVVKCAPYQRNTACPACLTAGRHATGPERGGFIDRTCSHCGFAWQQLALLPNEGLTP